MRSGPHRDLFPGALEMMILQTLRREPMHGYALAQVIKQTSGDLLQIEEGSLYPALQRMLKASWVAAEWGISARHRRGRGFMVMFPGGKQLGREVWRFDRMLDGIRRGMRPGDALGCG